MVRIQRFALAFMLIGSFALSGCANSRTKLASLFGRGGDDTFSDSIVDNRELPKSAREMADSVQDSLKDTKTKAADSKSAIVSNAKKRYTKSAKKLDSLDTRIDDVIARAKSRGDRTPPKSSKSDFPKDPFLDEFDALASKPAQIADKAKDSMLERFEAVEKEVAESTFGGGDDDVAEPLIAKVDRFDDKISKKIDSKLSDFADTASSLREANPFEELDDKLEDLVVDRTAELNKLDQPVSDFVDDVGSGFDEMVEEVVADAKADVPDMKIANIESEFVDLPKPTDVSAAIEKATQPIVEDAVAALKVSKDDFNQAKVAATSDDEFEDDFDLLFAEAAPSKKRSFQESQFRPASAQRSATSPQERTAKAPQQRSVKKPVKNPDTRVVQTPAAKSKVDPRFGTDFDRMIVDSDKLPQRPMTAQKPVTKSTFDEDEDQFTGVQNRLSTYDDFFEADNSVRANQPREASRKSNPFPSIDRVPEPVAIPVEPKLTVQPQPAPVVELPAPAEQPAPVSPFEEFEEFQEFDDELEEFGDDIPVAQTTTEPSPHKQPMRLVSMPTVVRVSGNTAADLSDRDMHASTFEVAATTSDLDRTPAELPNIVPGQTDNSVFDEPYIDLSAVTQTPLENVAWEVESESGITSGTKGTSPWIAWIAVALCSIALILLLRPATNRIS